MNIERRGFIFNITDHKLPLGCESHAQSPQALILNDRVRIYFSTRSRDSSNQFLSQVSFVEFDKQLSTVLRISEKSVICLGDLGCFDEHGIFPFHVCQTEDTLFGYTSGWSRRRSVPVETGIGLSISHDGGETFQRIGPGPVLSASLQEPFLVGDPFVRCFNGQFHMWYIFGTKWSEPVAGVGTERTYKIGHAVSSDGVNWRKDEGNQLIADALGQEECQALPSVIRIGNTYHMFFCFRSTFDFRSNSLNSYKIGYAYSTNLDFWQRADSELIWNGPQLDWDSSMQCYPHAFTVDDRFYLLYNGNAFGRYGFGLAEIHP